MKKSFMIAVKKQITLDVVVYCEVVANNAKEAVEEVKNNLQDFGVNEESFKKEALQMLKDKEYNEKEVKVISCGKSNQYHSAMECKLCSSLERKVV